MLLTIETTHQPATDLGFLLHKNPARANQIDLPFGQAHMFYSDVSETRCVFHLLLDLNPVTLVRGGEGKDGGGVMENYVNDRPYAASSFLSVAIAKGLRSALNGHSAERPELALTPIPLSLTVTPLPVRGDKEIVSKLFAPLGYEVAHETIALDPAFPEWGESPYVTLKLNGTQRLGDALQHLYVLIPVLDLSKHYFINEGEIEKLLEKGGDWLKSHPEREMIVRRYLKRRHSLANEALRRLMEVDESSSDGDAAADAAAQTAENTAAEGLEEAPRDKAEEKLETPLRLHDVRLDAVAQVLKDAGVRRVVDLGCGSGKLLKRLLVEKQFQDILGVDVALRDLEIAARRLRLESLPERQRARINLVQGALTYRDARIEGFEAIALVEVIEHIDPERLPAVERVVFEFAKPGIVVVTTPNREYNVKFESLPAGQFRHADHRFEWTRAEFQAWAEGIAARNAYHVRFEPLGDVDADLGAPSQMAIFERGTT